MKQIDIFPLPGPEETPEGRVWHPIVRLGRVIPFGYTQDPNDSDILNPVPLELELLDQAKKHLKKHPSRAVAAWLSANSGRYISHTGLIKRVKLEKSRSQKIVWLKYLAENYRKIIEKTEALEKSRLGHYTDNPSPTKTKKD